MIHPFIHRGLWRDVQVWVPAFSGLPDADGLLGARGVPVVLKVYPLIGWLWIGLVLAVLGATWRSVVAWRAQRGSRRAFPARTAAGTGSSTDPTLAPDG